MRTKKREALKKTTVVIPNYNGIRYLEKCLLSLLEIETEAQSDFLFDILVVDNGSDDGSEQITDRLRERMESEAAKSGSGQERDAYPALRQIRFEHNTGFCGAVNAGIRSAKTPYVLLLNNDTEVRQGFVRKLTEAIEEESRAFSVSAKMLSMKEPDRVDDAGDYYCALGWAFARGKGKAAAAYSKKTEVFAACAGAAIYRRELLLQLGCFDENHFAYLEDIDLAYRARIYGCRNLYCPEAEVLHAGSATTGSAHNPFKVRLSARNSVYLVYKNMPLFQLLLNLPFLAAGHLIKYFYFVKKGLGGDYRRGFWQGILLSCSKEGRAHKVKFSVKNVGNYIKIQMALWVNIIRRFA